MDTLGKRFIQNSYLLALMLICLFLLFHNNYFGPTFFFIFVSGIITFFVMFIVKLLERGEEEPGVGKPKKPWVKDLGRIIFLLIFFAVASFLFMVGMLFYAFKTGSMIT